jgi:hypothetical protein
MRDMLDVVVPLNPPASGIDGEARKAVAETNARIDQLITAVNRLTERPQTPSPLPGQVLAAFRALALVLAVRFMLVLALAGTFTLALLAMDHQTIISAAITVAFAVLTLGPLVYLEVRNRPAPPPAVSE